jgi:hypothetical protein
MAGIGLHSVFDAHISGSDDSSKTLLILIEGGESSPSIAKDGVPTPAIDREGLLTVVAFIDGGLTDPAHSF